MGLPPKYPTRKAVRRLKGEVTLCSVCKTIVRERRDKSRGNWFCENCGTVTKQILVMYPENSSRSYEGFIEVENMDSVSIEGVPNCLVSERELNAEITSVKYPEGRDKPKENKQFKGIAQLMNYYETDSNSDKRKWNVSRYTSYVGVVNTNFMMNRYQKSRAKHIIYKTGNLKKVCKNCSYEVIVTAICIWIMRRDKRKIRIPTNKFCRQVGLTEKKYTTIIENLLDLNL